MKHIQMRTRLCETLGIHAPIIQAGMAGGITSPSLVAAVSEAGGLGTLGAAYMSKDALRQAIREIKTRTQRPFSVNMLVYDPPERPLAASPALIEWVNLMRSEVGLNSWDGSIPDDEEPLDGCFNVLLDEQVPVFSVAFSLPGKYGAAAKSAGMKLIGMATTLEEARLLEAEGVDAIVAQGGEAGGHRGTIALKPGEDGAVIGTLPLVSLLCEALPHIPIIAAGGIMNGRGLAAALLLGADGVQLGTRFLACTESLAHPIYKKSVWNAKETDLTLTRAFSGRPARGIANRMTRTFAERNLSPLPYPLHNQLTREIRAAAGRLSAADYMSLWAGQGAAQLNHVDETADEIIRAIVEEAGLLVSGKTI
ncbi:NAD(P)H-dependent flavin oxidoreductase [Paenibacillus mendelii]|uniref:Probable nitronate monooxygenase n=1 Tax=Paenibacillus mendelii TaxID=206163 RepID=A0ABV6JGH2_9BACL|nr:nitronate monooxygenase [Paenibacillus mendelii]MCQ6557516.1 nitronate monooxygenase [Paenibacillus mendelii]